MAFKKYSKKFVDTNVYKTLEILTFFVNRSLSQKSLPLLVPDNKIKTRYRCLCPLRKEKTSSFKLHNNNPYKIWVFKCFSCGASGDVFCFLMISEGIEFWDALIMVKKAFPNYYSKYKTPISKKQLRLNFPVNQKGEFIWISKDMRQIGFQ